MKSSNERGFVLISALIILLMFGGFLALLADSAHLQYARQRAQTAADAAAITGLYEMERGNSAGMFEAAKMDAERNGMSGAGVRVEVNCPPRSGEYASDLKAVEANIVSRTPTIFMRIFGPAAATVAARAVAIRNDAGGVVLGE